MIQNVQIVLSNGGHEVSDPGIMIRPALCAEAVADLFALPWHLAFGLLVFDQPVERVSALALARAARGPGPAGKAVRCAPAIGPSDRGQRPLPGGLVQLEQVGVHQRCPEAVHLGQCRQLAQDVHPTQAVASFAHREVGLPAVVHSPAHAVGEHALLGFQGLAAALGVNEEISPHAGTATCSQFSLPPTRRPVSSWWVSGAAVTCECIKKCDGTPPRGNKFFDTLRRI